MGSIFTAGHFIGATISTSFLYSEETGITLNE